MPPAANDGRRQELGGAFSDKETRRKPLVFAADAVYGDSKAVWYRRARAGAPMNSAVPGSQGVFGMETLRKKGSGEGREVFGTVREYTPTPACGEHVASRVCTCAIMMNRRTHSVVRAG